MDWVDVSMKKKIVNLTQLQTVWSNVAECGWEIDVYIYLTVINYCEWSVDFIDWLTYCNKLTWLVKNKNSLMKRTQTIGGERGGGMRGRSWTVTYRDSGFFVHSSGLVGGFRYSIPRLFFQVFHWAQRINYIVGIWYLSDFFKLINFGISSIISIPEV